MFKTFILAFSTVGILASLVFIYSGFKRIKENNERFKLSDVLKETKFKNSTGYQLLVEGVFGIVLGIALIYGSLNWLE